MANYNGRGWRCMVLEDRAAADSVAAPGGGVALCDLFGHGAGGAIPYGILLRAILYRAGLFVGVPAGPQCLAMVTPGLPVVGLWLELHPGWFHEPKAEAVHILANGPQADTIAKRPASIEARGRIVHRVHKIDTPHIPAAAVVAAALAV